MTEHLIRFRRGWRWLNAARQEQPTLVTLPLPSLAEFPNPFYLARTFQPPTLNRNAETLWLDLESVRGLVSIELNGEALPRTESDSRVERIPLSDTLPPRNRLVLQVDVNAVTTAEWGIIALVIRNI